MKKILAAWTIWIAWMALTVALGGRLPHTLFGLLLIGVPTLCCVLIFRGQRTLPLWANISLLIVQGAAGLYATTFLVLFYTASAGPWPYACERPALQGEIPSSRVEYANQVISCPVPAPEKMEFVRDYGVIEMQWNIELQWMAETSSGTPVTQPVHDRLYMRARTTDGKALGISGARVEEYGGRGPEFLASYSSRVSFDGHPETFAIEVSKATGELIEPLKFDYRRLHCSCERSGI